MTQEVTQEEFNNWQDNKVTKEVMKGLNQIRDDLKEFLAAGGTLNKEGVSTEFVVGRIQGLNDFLLVQYEESKEDKRDQYEY